MEEISYMEIIQSEWKKGAKDNQKMLEKHRLLIENYTYACMKELDKRRGSETG